MELMWIFLSLFAGISSAVIILLNQYFKIYGLHLVILSRAFILIMIIPIAFFIEWPKSYIYYIAVSITGVLAAYGDITIFNAVAKIGSGVISRLTPLLVPITFITWFIVQPSDIGLYLAEPKRSIGIIIALSACVFFSMQLQSKCMVSKEALKIMIPVVIAYGLNGTLAKLAMNNADLYEGVYGYMVIQSGFALLSTALFYIYKNKKTDKKIIPASIDKRLIYISFALGVLWITHVALKVSAFTFIDNPAYPNAVVMLSPLWILLFYKIINHKENAKITYGIGILISTIILAILTTL